MTFKVMTATFLTVTSFVTPMMSQTKKMTSPQAMMASQTLMMTSENKLTKKRIPLQKITLTKRRTHNKIWG